jgi:hypothetical protein
MLGFVISTIAFSLAVYGLNHCFSAQSPDGERAREFVVMALATGIFIGVGWIVDQADGDTDLPHPSVSEVMSSGDPMQIAKILAGMN